MTTPRQSQCLAAIRRHWRKHQQSPTRTELGQALGITKVSAHLLVRKLEAAGAVVVRPGQWRNIFVREAS